MKPIIKSEFKFQKKYTETSIYQSLSNSCKETFAIFFFSNDESLSMRLLLCRIHILEENVITELIKKQQQ